jgi:WXG100 family type VII secretion target
MSRLYVSHDELDSLAAQSRHVADSLVNETSALLSRLESLQAEWAGASSGPLADAMRRTRATSRELQIELEQIGRFLTDMSETFAAADATVASSFDVSDESPGSQRTRIPDPDGMLLLGSTNALTVEDLLAFWSSKHEGPGLDIPLGIDDAGQSVNLDLDSAGHIIVAGTTGSGKTELLRWLLSAGAALWPPNRLQLAMLDFKGSEFGALSYLPHVVSAASRFDAQGVDIVLDTVEARVSEAIAPTRPHLLVVVDEFATLQYDAPDSVERLVELMRAGRKADVTFLLGTQRPSSLYSSRVLPNASTRIALRLASREDGEALGLPDAYRVPSTTPGTALLIAGAARAIRFKSPFADRLRIQTESGIDSGLEALVRVASLAYQQFV